MKKNKQSQRPGTGLLFFITCLLLLSFSVNANAVTIFVDINATGAGDGTSWTDAYPFLQDGLGAAASGDQVWVAAGTYYPDEGAGQVDGDRSATFAVPDGVALYGGFAGSETSLGDRDWSANVTILSGDLDTDGYVDSANSYHVVTFNNVGALTVLDGFHVVLGYAETAGGGGILNNAGSPKIANCDIYDNETDYYGAGIYNDGAAGQCAPSIVNCAIHDNMSTADGGGVYNFGDCIPAFINCTIANNDADSGGGIYNLGTACLPDFTNCIAWGNYASTSGDTVYNAGGAVPVFSWCDLEDSGGSASWDTAMGTDNGNNIDADPIFHTNLNLLPTSPCIDNGNNAANLEPLDLRHQGRIQGGIVDMGSYETDILYVDQDATGANNGSSWVNAYVCLQDALSSAATGNHVWVAAGTYYPDEGIGQTDGDRSSTFAIPSDVAVFGGFDGTDGAGGGAMEMALVQRNLEQNIVILSGDLSQDDFGFDRNSDNAYHVVSFLFVNDQTVLDGFTILAGNADGDGNDDQGGGIYNDGDDEEDDGSNPMIVNCIIAGNYAEYRGGGIYNRNFSFTTSEPDGGRRMKFFNCLITGNMSGSDGGGMYNNGFFITRSCPLLINCIFNGNYASGDGGSMFNDRWMGSANALLINCTFSGSYAGGDGNEVYNYGTYSDGPSFVNCILWNDAPIGNSDIGPVSYAYCDIKGSGGSASWDTSLGTDLGNNIDADPLFVTPPDPADAPSIDGDLRLLPGSPCLDVGNNTANPMPVDAIGQPRIQNGIIDLGAFEGTLTTPYDNLIEWNGNLVADFEGRGMWYHDGSSWNWMTNQSNVQQMLVWD
ncbi:MAG: choice-of-anchor Q domain-containing protein, partial [Thermodesulfobacteriota bacterium]|nr:choice-of-anchor Q domain-containing protein [Thermodesulfobacteriota bacterium]